MNAIAIRTHSLFSPSRLAMLQKCPSWLSKPSLTAGDMPLVQRGIDLHDSITSAFMQGLQGHDDSIIDYCLRTLLEIKQGFPHAEWTPEQALDIGIPHVSGYADIIGRFDDTAIIIELKTGYGNRPEASGNLQLKAYAAALLRQVETVHGYLIEADQRQVTSATWTRQDLLNVHNEIIETIRQSLQGGHYQAGPHCEYCNKALICPALQEAVDSVTAAEAAISETKTLTPAEVSSKLSEYWERIDLVERYWGNLKSRAMQIIEAGGEVAGFTVKVSSGARKWIDEAAAANALNDAGIDPFSLMCLQSPAVIEKSLKATGMKTGEIKGLLSGLTSAGERRQLIKVAGPSSDLVNTTSLRCRK